MVISVGKKLLTENNTSIWCLDNNTIGVSDPSVQSLSLMNLTLTGYTLGGTLALIELYNPMDFLLSGVTAMYVRVTSFPICKLNFRDMDCGSFLTMDEPCTVTFIDCNITGTFVSTFYLILFVFKRHNHVQHGFILFICGIWFKSWNHELHSNHI